MAAIIWHYALGLVRRRRQVATQSALARLDDRILKDLGMDRSEIGSVAAERYGDCAATRVRTLRS